MTKKKQKAIGEVGISIPNLGTLKCKLPINIEFSQGESQNNLWAAFSPDISVYGIGGSINEALNDLFETAFELLKDYSDTPAKGLHKSAKDELKRLQKHFTMKEGV